MDCAVDPRGTLSRFYVHTARSLNTLFDILLEKGHRTCGKEPLEDGHNVEGSFPKAAYKALILSSIDRGTYDSARTKSQCRAYGTRILGALGPLDDTSCHTRDHTRVGRYMVWCSLHRVPFESQQHMMPGSRFADGFGT